MSKLPLYLKETGSGSSTWHSVGACGLCKRGNGELQLKDSNTYTWPYTTILVNESILQVKIKCITHFKKDSLHLGTFTSNWEGRYWFHQIIESLLYQSIFAPSSLLIRKIFIWEAPMYQVPLTTWDTWVKKTKGPWGAYTSDGQERDLTRFYSHRYSQSFHKERYLGNKGTYENLAGLNLWTTFLNPGLPVRLSIQPPPIIVSYENNTLWRWFTDPKSLLI